MPPGSSPEQVYDVFRYLAGRVRIMFTLCNKLFSIFYVNFFINFFWTLSIIESNHGNYQQLLKRYMASGSHCPIGSHKLLVVVIGQRPR